MSTPILTTKLCIPPTCPDLVPRPRLIERLNEGMRRKLTLISAPAGFGKTTLLREWIAGCGPHTRVAWISLDESDNDPVRFWSYFIAALQMLKASLGENALSLLYAQQSQPPSNESFLTVLVNEIAAFYDNFALVLDDYRVISAPLIHNAISFLLDHLPPQVMDLLD